MTLGLNIVISTWKSKAKLTINVPLILKVRDFFGFFEGAETFLMSKLPLASLRQFRRQKVLAPSKKPAKWLIMCFSQLKKHKIPNF
jgi:hypothetical protein